MKNEMPYGDYKGMSFYEILDKDPGHLLWCLMNLDDRNLKARIDDFLDKAPPHRLKKLLNLFEMES